MPDYFYKLGATKAAQDLGVWLSSGLDNPTAPPANRYTKVAIDRMIEKLAKPKSPKRKGKGTVSTPAGKGTRFKAMVQKLKKKKKKGTKATRGR